MPPFQSDHCQIFFTKEKDRRISEQNATQLESKRITTGFWARQWHQVVAGTSMQSHQILCWTNCAKGSRRISWCSAAQLCNLWAWCQMRKFEKSCLRREWTQHSVKAESLQGTESDPNLSWVNKWILCCPRKGETSWNPQSTSKQQQKLHLFRIFGEIEIWQTFESLTQMDC